MPRLFDLVSVSDAKLRLAFWYALRNTLVAADLEQASRISYGCRDRRFQRVVTLAGQLIAGARQHAVLVQVLVGLVKRHRLPLLSCTSIVTEPVCWLTGQKQVVHSSQACPCTGKVRAVVLLAPARFVVCASYGR